MPQVHFNAPAPGNGLFLSSSGGHFSELLYVAKRFNATENSLFITFASSDTQIANPVIRIQHIPYIEPRRFWPLIRALPPILLVLRKNQFDYVASTGASIALIGYLLAKMRRMPFYYVESIARQTSLSLTAKLLKLFGLPRMFVQSPNLLNQSTVYLEHPLKKYRTEWQPIPKNPLRAKVFVALGTIRGYEFDRAVEIVLSILDGSEIVVWQTGSTKRFDLPGKTHLELERGIFMDKISEADIVICHAGVGIIGDSLRSGKVPLVIPRRAIFLEHVDDHQVEIVDLLSNDGLIVNLEVNPSKILFHEVLSRKVLLR